MDEQRPVRSYRELKVWEKAMDLVEAVYTVTRSWPREELYGLTSQVRRAAVSIPSNIAEGQGRTSTKEFLHHLSIAYGSLLELETQLLIAERLHYLQIDTMKDLLASTAEVGRIINGLSRKLAIKQSNSLTTNH
ncbi:MAG TPA: four helix bundle protein [Chloroflexia bacterium]|nr:four helix bundle protein [Chloroflexia bacterium]